MSKLEKKDTRSLLPFAILSALVLIFAAGTAFAAAGGCGRPGSCAPSRTFSPNDEETATLTPTSNQVPDVKPRQTPTPTPLPMPGWLHTQGAQIVNAQGQNVILRGVNLSGLEYDPSGSQISQSEVDYIGQNWHARVIRIPINQDWVLNDPAYLNRMDTIVSWITHAGMYVILDLQWLDTTREIAPIPDGNTPAMWQKLATRYANNPAVIYDLYTQPHDVTWSTWQPIASQLVSVIHSANPNALIVVSGVQWGYDLRGVANQPVIGSNVVYSAHEYSWNEPIPRSQAWEYLVGSVPMYIGEWGGRDQDVSPWGTTLRDYLRSHGIGHTAWNWDVWPYLTKNASRGNYTPTKFGAMVRDDLLNASNIAGNQETFSDLSRHDSVRRNRR